MIVGFVNARLEPTVRLIVRDIAGGDHDLETNVDTGYEGAMTLQPSVIAAFGLPWILRITSILADGSKVYSNVHAAIILWDGMVRKVDVEAAQIRPLLGMKLVEGNRLQIDAKVGGRVVIEPLPATQP